MKLNGILITRIRDFQEFFNFKEFMRQRDQLARINPDMFCDTPAQIGHLRSLTRWTEGIGNTPEICSGQLNETQLNVLRDSLSKNDFNAIVALSELLGPTASARLDPMEICACLGVAVTDSDHGVGSVLPGHPRHLTPLPEGTVLAQPLKTFLLVNPTDDPRPALIHLNGQTIGLNAGECARVLMCGQYALRLCHNTSAGNYCAKLLPQPDRTTRLSLSNGAQPVDLGPVDQFALNELGCVYVTRDKNRRLNHRHRRLNPFELDVIIPQSEQPVWIEFTPNGQGVIVYTDQRSRYTLRTGLPAPLIEHNITHL